MSIKIDVPADIVTKATEIVMAISFDEAMSYLVKGPSKHLIIEPGCSFEMFLSNVKPYGYRMCKFTFAISHECPDDRTHWVVDQEINAIIICKEDSVHLKGF